MAFPNCLEICQSELFVSEEELRAKYPDATVDKVLRIRELYNWAVANPAEPQRVFIDYCIGRFGVSKHAAYSDLKIVKILLPALNEAPVDYHRQKSMEMYLEAYRMAKARKDAKAMVAAAKGYAEVSGANREIEQDIPVDKIITQPFIPTDDPTPLGIKPLENRAAVVKRVMEKYKSADIEDVQFEEADLQLDALYAPVLPQQSENDAE